MQSKQAKDHTFVSISSMNPAIPSTNQIRFLYHIHLAPRPSSLFCSSKCTDLKE